MSPYRPPGTPVFPSWKATLPIPRYTTNIVWQLGMSDLKLQVVSHQTQAGLPYQHLHAQIVTPTGILTPAALKSLAIPTGMIWSQGVVIEGKLPLWAAGYLVHACHPAAWVATFDPRLGNDRLQSGGAVVVATHSPQVAEGDVLLLTIPDAVL